MKRKEIELREGSTSPAQHGSANGVAIDSLFIFSNKFPVVINSIYIAQMLIYTDQYLMATSHCNFCSTDFKN